MEDNGINRRESDLIALEEIELARQMEPNVFWSSDADEHHSTTLLRDVFQVTNGSLLFGGDYHSIYKIPYPLRNLDESEFTPHVVSLGPYHNGQTHLMGMESHKIRAFYQMSFRIDQKNMERNFTSIHRNDRDWWVEQFKRADIQSLRRYYDQLDPVAWPQEAEGPHEQDKFIRMMLLDGCFMLEILRAPELKGSSGRRNCREIGHDPIFGGNSYILPRIKKDMLLLENQLPLLLLEKLVVNANRCLDETSEDYVQDPKMYVRGLVMEFFELEEPVENYRHSLHLLDMYMRSIVNYDDEEEFDDQPIIVFEGKPQSIRKVMWSAEMLHNAGIRFKRSETRSLSFQNGVLSLPTIVIDGNTRCLFLNLMAFEGLHVELEKKVITSYISLMAGLITTTKDVEILSNMGIISNTLGNDHDVVQLFNFLARDSPFEPDDDTKYMLAEIERNYNDRMDKWNIRFREWRGNLKDKYFKYPCTCISLTAAGVILLLLTIIQTIFIVAAFYSVNQ